MKFQSISTITKIYRQKALWRSVMWQKRNLRQCRIFSNWDQSDRLRCSLPSKYIFDPQIQYLSSLSDYFVAQFNTMQQPTNFERLRVWWWTLMLDFFTFIENWYHKLPTGKIVQKIVFIFIACYLWAGFYHFSCDNGDGRVYGASLSSLAEYKNYPKY